MLGLHSTSLILEVACNRFWGRLAAPQVCMMIDRILCRWVFEQFILLSDLTTITAHGNWKWPQAHASQFPASFGLAGWRSWLQTLKSGIFKEPHFLCMLQRLCNLYIVEADINLTSDSFTWLTTSLNSGEIWRKSTWNFCACLYWN